MNTVGVRQYFINTSYPRGLISILLLWSSLFWTVASNPTLFHLPEDSFEIVDGVLMVTAGGATKSFVPGLGWFPEVLPDAPHFDESGVSVSAATLEALGFVQPRLLGIRLGGDIDLRIVLDLAGAFDDETLKGLAGTGVLAEGAALRLAFPSMLLPASLPKLPTGFDLRFLVDREGTTVELRGPPLRYEVFTLVDPKRLVLDLVPLQETKVIPERKVLRKGVVYRRFGAVTEIGTSAVHVLEFDPGSGAFRVVGASGEPRTLSELAEGAFAAINAGYFDTETFSAIGFLEVDDGLLSLPSRNRASVGFGAAGAVIDRVAAEVTIRVNGGAVFTGSSSASDSIAVSTATNLVVGTPRVGVITVANGVAQENKIGPRAVPKDGFALTYPAETRALALVNPGDRVALEVSLLPRSFNGVRYAVEAGPLLVASGHPALQPERESFQTGQRILDAYTQQAAIGLGGDGKVFFVVAEAMNAAGLVPLLISLGIRDAMRLDSGSSTMMLADGQLLNRAQERRVVSAIVFLPNVR